MMMEEIYKHALSKKVLAIAAINPKIGDWSAYIDAVPGINHDVEKYEVARSGEKLPYQVAKLIFPLEAQNYKWRD
jgi:hypothetical protein